VRRALIAALLVAVSISAGSPASASLQLKASPYVPEPAYYSPVAVDGKVFPVARSNFFAAMHFDDGWHDPRFRFIDGKWRLVGIHEGIDIVAEKGTPMLAFMDGTIERVGWTFYSGMRIGLRGVDGRYYFYAHSSEVLVSEGDRVRAGDVIGRVGNSGYGEEWTEDEFVPHLHFGIEGPSGWENPYPVLVETYRAAVDAGRAGEARLAEHAAAQDEAAWRAEAGRLYTTFGIPLPA
jgi:murein DD-endopeptidase MepM/ murein hydrolase activator NlpD